MPNELACANIEFYLKKPMELDKVIDFINELNKSPVKLSASEQARKDAKAAELDRINLLISKKVAEGLNSVSLSAPIWGDTIQQLKAEGFKIEVDMRSYSDHCLISWGE
jgi:hypothetical protein